MGARRACLSELLCSAFQLKQSTTSGDRPRPPRGTGFTGRVFASTDGWTTCAQGHRHWGRAGAAGLLLHRDGEEGPEVLLQHRALWSHHGGTWGTPGGALHAGEPPHDGALREVREELGLPPEDVVLGARSVDDHGGWAYTTVLARPARPIEAARPAAGRRERRRRLVAARRPGRGGPAPRARGVARAVAAPAGDAAR